MPVRANHISTRREQTPPADTLRAELRLEVRIECLRNGYSSRRNIYCEPGRGSPAIDASANPLAFDCDQPGEPHRCARGAAPDICAIEWNPDPIFTTDFETCGDLP